MWTVPQRIPPKTRQRQESLQASKMPDRVEYEPLLAGLFNWTAAMSLNWQDGRNWSDFPPATLLNSPTAADDLEFTTRGGTVLVPNGGSANSVTVKGPTSPVSLVAGDTIRISNALSVTAGTLNVDADQALPTTAARGGREDHYDRRRGESARGHGQCRGEHSSGYGHDARFGGEPHVRCRRSGFD